MSGREDLEVFLDGFLDQVAEMGMGLAGRLVARTGGFMVKDIGQENAENEG